MKYNIIQKGNEFIKQNVIRDYIFTLIRDVIISGIIPFALQQIELITNVQGLLLATLLFIVLVSSEALNIMKKLDSKAQKSTDLWTIQNNVDTKLSNIREAYRTILTGKRTNTNIPELFETYYEGEIEKLETSITEAATRDKLFVQKGHVFNTNTLLLGFTGASQDIFRAVHLLEDNVWFFGSISKRYFQQVYELVQDKKIRQVRRLFLYSSEEELESPETKKLVRFHKNSDNYDYRVMSVNDFEVIVHDRELEIYRDFGIYGNHIIYIGEDYRQDHVVGFYMRNLEIIQKYIDFFDDCWRPPNARKLIGPEWEEPITINDLFINNSKP